MPLGGGGIGGGGIWGGPANVPVNDLDIQGMNSDQVIMDLMQLDIASQTTGATATDIVQHFDGGLITAPESIDLSSLLTTASLNTINSYYDAYIAGQNTDPDYLAQFSSAEWAAWHSGPTSDIGNMISFQQMAFQYAFQQFMAQGLTQTDFQASQKTAFATSYMINYAGSLMSLNPGLGFHDALNYAAGVLNSDPGRVADFAQAAKDTIETVVVNGTYDPYGNSGDFTITYSTTNGQYGVTTNGQYGAAAAHTLHGDEKDPEARQTILDNNTIATHHGALLVTTVVKDDNGVPILDDHGQQIVETDYLADNNHIVKVVNEYHASLTDPNTGLATDGRFFQTREAMNTFLKDQWAHGQDNWAENYGLSGHANDSTYMYAGAANPGWSGAISLHFTDDAGHATNATIPDGAWVDVIYWHEYDHAHNGVGVPISTPADEYAAYIYGLQQTHLI